MIELKPGEEIKNAKIVKADLSMEEHGTFVLWLTLKGAGWDICFGGRVLGKGYVGAREFTGYAKGIEEIMRIMDVVGVSRFSELEGKYVRTVVPGLGGTVEKIGNIIDGKWFDYTKFYGKCME